MSQAIITTDRLGKRYILGEHLAKSPPMLRDVVARRLREMRGLLTGARREKPRGEEFWALKDVSFDVKPGEVVGLIGRNGAGKSTLLKVLSRIVEPTTGMARLRGRVASLLEVGTGFHQELTGRENIYMNGTILGMRKAEIDRKFDAIVAFSEIEEFLDTPVKRYSSGMYVRLAFAVAAHLEPEILIVDEVLAVGDAAFQKKCLGKMQDVASGDGRTILFVSHNMGAMAQLCDRGILLEHGQITADGSVREAIEKYLQANADHRSSRATFPIDPSKPGQVILTEIRPAGGGEPAANYTCDESFVVRVEYEIRSPIGAPRLWFTVLNLEGIRVFYSDFRDGDPEISTRLKNGRHAFEVTFPPRLLAEGTYVIDVGVDSDYVGPIDNHTNCCEFTLRDMIGHRKNRPGFFSTLLPWKLVDATAAL